MQIRLFGLLHLKAGESFAGNVYVNNFQERIDVYVNNAINLSHSLQRRGVEFILLTNNKSIVDEVIKSNSQELQVIEIPFLTKIPSGVKCFSAHFKIDVFRYLSSLSDEYTGVCDLDMMCINAFPACFLNNIENRIPMVYDISDQVIAAYGYDVIIRDLELIHHLKSEGKWAGGEFITGAPDFFATLTAEIDKIFDNYLNVLGKLHHVSDEAIVSAALEIIRKKGIYISDAGILGIVGRYWNARTLHAQKPLEYFMKCSFLHLPLDKFFLAEMAKKELSGFAAFKREYMLYRRSPISILKKIIKRILRIFKPNS